MNETREQYLERIINGSTAYINVKDRRDRKMLVRADREIIKSEIDKKFLAILRISQREDYPRNRFELGYESGRFEVEVKNLFLSGGLTTHEEKFLKKCEYIAMFEVNEEVNEKEA